MSKSEAAEDQAAKSPDLLPCPFCRVVPDHVPGVFPRTSTSGIVEHPAGECVLAGIRAGYSAWNRRSPAVPSQQGGLTIQKIREELWRRRDLCPFEGLSWSAQTALQELDDWIEAKLQEPDRQEGAEATGRQGTQSVGAGAPRRSAAENPGNGGACSMAGPPDRVPLRPGRMIPFLE